MSDLVNRMDNHPGLNSFTFPDRNFLNQIDVCRIMMELPILSGRSAGGSARGLGP